MSDGALARSQPAPPQPMLRLLSDARLAALAAKGSAPAFAAIYQRHHQAVYRYCRSILRDEHDARDALQNTMVKAMSALDGETREIAVRPWLFRIAHNESISLIRRRSPDVAIDQVAELPAAEDGAEARARVQGLIADLDLLTERQRSALVMRELSGLEFGEIGVALETSPEGAKQAVYEARMALRELEGAREIDCAEIRRRISADDRRRLRARGVRAHMRSCSDCRDFDAQIRNRSGQLAAIAPPLPAPIALGILEGILGGGGGGGGAAALAAGGGGSALAGLGSGAALKLGAAAMVAAGVGGVAIEARSADGRAEPRSAIAVSGAVPGGDAAETAPGDGAGEGTPAGRGADTRNDGGSQGGGHGGGEAAEGKDAGAGSAQSGGAEDPVSPGSGPEAPATPASPVAEQDAPSAPSASAPGAGPTGTPPGHGGTPPGQGGTPPGQGGTPPGLGSPPPGQGGTPPGLSSPPPGQGGTPPGQGGTPPGLGGVAPPGQGGTPPGHGGTPPGQGNGPKS